MSTRKNTAYNVAYRVFSVLLPLVTAPYLSRTVGREGVGLYSYAWNISYFFCLVAMLGLENYGTRAIAAVRDDRRAPQPGWCCWSGPAMCCWWPGRRSPSPSP